MGDPACHLASVCLGCGRFLETADLDICPHCGNPVDGTTEGQPNPTITAPESGTRPNPVT